MAFEIFTVAVNTSGTPEIIVHPPSSFDYVALGAILISLGTLGFTIWNANRTRRSEQLKVARELMYSIIECRQVVDTLYDRYRASTPKDDQDRGLEVLEWVRSIGDLMYEIEEFRSFVTFQGIENKSEILLYKMRLHGLLEYVKVLRSGISLEDSQTKDHYDRWTTELREWCKKGNEKRLPTNTPIKKEGK